MFFLILLSLALDAPKFEALTTQAPITGALSALAPNWSVTLGGQTVPIGKLVELRQVGLVRPAAPTDKPHLRLAGGDVWPIQLSGLQDDKLRFTADFGSNQEFMLPVTAIAELWLMAAKPVENAPRTSDEVLLSNGDVHRGTVTHIVKGDVGLEAGGKKLNLPVDKVVRIVFSSELVRAPKVSGPTARVTLTNGARVTLKDASFQDGRVSGKTVHNLNVRFLLSEIAHVAINGGPALYLSDLTPKSYEHTPFLGTHWALARDCCTDQSRPLRIGHNTYDRGVGMHSRSRVVYAVPAGTVRFEAWVGLDAVAGRLGEVRVTVELDGKPAYGPVELAGQQQPRRVSIAVPTGAKELALFVDFGAGGDTQDHVDWGDARFVRGP